MHKTATSIKIKPVRCPSCRVTGHLNALSEISGNESWYTSDGLTRCERPADIVGDSNYYPQVAAHCKCGYSWRMRGVRQVKDLDVET